MEIRSAPPGYEAAGEDAAFRRRGDRRFLRVAGRSPREMLNALLTNTPPGELTGEGSWRKGTAVYSALLTNKGKLVTDLRVLRDPDQGFILDLPLTGLPGALAHLGSHLPPRLARVEEGFQEPMVLTLAGPRTPELFEAVGREAGLPVPLPPLEGMAEGDEWVGVGPGAGLVRVVGSGELRADAWDLILDADLGTRFTSLLERAGAVAASREAVDLLRLEKGRPSFGSDMDETIIPVEAGIGALAIDPTKGCYTGQEVIIRIRDRGHVNKLLRGLLLGQAPPPPAGARLFHEDGEKSVGWITSSAVSPRFGETLALGYVRRPLGPGAVVHLGESDGPEVRVRGLGPEGWILD